MSSKAGSRATAAKPSLGDAAPAPLALFSVFAPIVIVLAGALAYANALSASFVFDSRQILTDSRLDSAKDALTRSRRPVADLTLALNRATSGSEPRAYLAVNVLIHLAAALTLYGLVRRSIRAAGFIPAVQLQRQAKPVGGHKTKDHARSRRFTGDVSDPIRNPTLLAFAIALLWAVHPLTTQGVTYIIQRAESLMALFYLLTLYCVVRAAQSARPVGWGIAAVLACALGMGSKLIMITAPVVALMADRAFVAGSFKEALRRRWLLYLGLFGTWAIPLGQGAIQAVLNPEARANETVGLAFKGISPLHYALTQPGVIRHYLGLSLWPKRLCLDYDWPVATSLTPVFTDVAVIVLLVIAAICAYCKRPRVGFAALAFFIILAPTSSFIPIKDPVFEHRMYLPLAAVVALVVAAAYWLVAAAVRRISPSLAGIVTAVLAAFVAVPLGFATHRRNQDYGSDEVMWRDVHFKQPHSGRAHFNLAHNLYDKMQLDESIALMREAVRINPRMIDWQFGLGSTLVEAGRLADALGPLTEALKLKPNHGPAHALLGSALEGLGRQSEALPHYEEAASLGAASADVCYNLANAYMAALRDDLAERHFLEAIRLRPTMSEAYINLGNLYSSGGRPEEAIAQYRKGIESETHAAHRRPLVLAQGHNNLGNTLGGQSRFDEAIAEYRAAIAAKPDYYQAHYGLGWALSLAGRFEEAAAAYAECLRLNPNHTEARERLDALQPSR